MNEDDLCPVPLDDEHFLQSSDVQQPPDQPLPDSLASHQTPRKYPMRVRARPSYLKDYSGTRIYASARDRQNRLHISELHIYENSLICKSERQTCIYPKRANKQINLHISDF